MNPRKKLLLIGSGLLLLAFSTMILSGAWVKRSFDQDLAKASSAADACLDDPVKHKERCNFAINQFIALHDELATPEQQKKRLAALKKLGACQQAVGHSEGAIESFNSIAMETPQDSAPYRDLAMAYSSAGRHAEAERSATLAMQLAPDSWKAYQVKARVLYRAEKYPEALAALEKAFDLAPRTEKTALASALEQVSAKLAESAPEKAEANNHPRNAATNPAGKAKP